MNEHGVNMHPYLFVAIIRIFVASHPITCPPPARPPARPQPHVLPQTRSLHFQYSKKRSNQVALMKLAEGNEAFMFLSVYPPVPQLHVHIVPSEPR